MIPTIRSVSNTTLYGVGTPIHQIITIEATFDAGVGAVLLYDGEVAPSAPVVTVTREPDAVGNGQLTIDILMEPLIPGIHVLGLTDANGESFTGVQVLVAIASLLPPMTPIVLEPTAKVRERSLQD
jgi:hypothetical protein